MGKLTRPLSLGDGRLPSRAKLATLPTPLEGGATLPDGASLWMKRDDLTGPHVAPETRRFRCAEPDGPADYGKNVDFDERRSAGRGPLATVGGTHRWRTEVPSPRVQS